MSTLSDRLRVVAPDPAADLVRRYAVNRDPDAATELVRRHGGRVYGVCRRILGDAHEADDAFQAVWLVFARRAAAVPADAAAGWLYGVAVRTATKAKIMTAKRQRIVASGLRQRAGEPTPTDPAEQAELLAALDAELAALPDELRTAVLACDLSETPRKQAAAALGWPEGTLASRLRKARELLAVRLRKRGFALPATGVALAVPVPHATAAAAVGLLRGEAAPPFVHLIAEAVLRTAKAKLLLIGLIAGLAAAGMVWAAQPPEPPPQPADLPPVAPTGWADAGLLTAHGQMVYSAAFRPDGKQFATAGADGTVIVWDAATLKPTTRFEVVKNWPPPAPAKPAIPQRVTWRSPGLAPPPIRLQWTQAGHLWVWHLNPAEEWGGTVFDPATGRPAADGAFRPTGRFSHATAFDGTRLLTRRTDEDSDQYILSPLVGDGPDVPLDVPKEIGSDYRVGVLHAVFARDGKTVVMLEFGRSATVPEELRERMRLRVCDTATGRTVRLIPAPGFSVREEPLNADGRHLVVWGQREGGLTVFDYATWTGRRFDMPTPGQHALTATGFSADGQTLLAATRRYVNQRHMFEVCTWDVATGRPGPVFPTHTHLTPAVRAGNPFQVLSMVCQVLESPDGRLRLAVYGTPPHNQTRPSVFVWDEAARAANAGVQVWRRTAD